MNLVRVKVFYVVVALMLGVLTKQEAQVPDTSCSDAQVFCDSASFYGPWSLPKTLVGNSFQICSTSTGGEGSSNNPLFFPFVPCKNHVKIELHYTLLKPQAGTNNKKGYQYGITYDCPSSIASENEYIVCDGSQITNATTIIEEYNFEPGHTYYLYIDGFEASQMNFTLNVLDGIGCLKVDSTDYYSIEDEDNYIAINDTVSLCADGTFKIESHGINNTDRYLWYTQDTLEYSDSSKLIYTFDNRDSIYKICSQGYTDCGVSKENCFYVRVDTIEDQYLPDTGFCATQLSQGVIPDGWLGGTIAAVSSGNFTYNVVEDNGCHYRQHIHITSYPEPVISKDTIICGIDSLVSGSVVLRNQSMLSIDTVTEHGCDSKIHTKFYFFNFEGEISPLQCSGNGDNTFQLAIQNAKYDHSRYDSIIVEWYVDNILVAHGQDFTLKGITRNAKYSAQVLLYQNNLECVIDLGEIDLNDMPNADFSLPADTICSSDSFFIDIKDYNPQYDYNVSVEGTTAKNLGGGRYGMKWGDEDNYIITVTCLYDGCQLQQSKSVYVKKEIEVPFIDCTNSTNNSVVFDWVTSSGVSQYEIWLNGVYKETVSSGPYSVTGLAYGESVDIKVKTLCNCICEDKIDSTVCKALDCPDHTVAIKDIPGTICYDDLPDSMRIGISADTIGEVKWIGNAIDENGVIYKDSLTIGDNYIRLEYKIGDCLYPVDTVITIYPPLELGYNTFDNSCYYTGDGEFDIYFSNVELVSFLLNGQEQDSLHVVNLEAGDYHFSLTDINGCTYENDFTINSPAEPELDINGEEFVKFNTSYSYYMDSDIDVLSKKWIQYKNSDTIVLCENCDTVHIVPDDDFMLCVQIEYDTLCEKEACLEVRIDRESKIYAPNIFTPNSDGVNDVFNVSSGNGLPINIKSLKIYNRWGELVYEKNNYVVGAEIKDGWNGRFRGKRAMTGVYVYYVEVESVEGKITKFFGDITLVR